MVNADRELDVVLFGATSFVGRLCAEYLARAAPPQARVGLAAARASGCAICRPRSAAAPPTGRCSSPMRVTERSLRELAQASRVVATTVGPYRRYGLPVLEACATAGTHYADLTGEVLFMREAIDRFDAVAARAARASCTAAASIRSRPTSACCCCRRRSRRTARASSSKRRSSCGR